MIKVQVGQPIPLNLQLYDGKSDVKVMSIIVDSNKNEVFRADLSHVSNGLYLNMDFPMPEFVDFVIAQYFTDKPEEYAVVTDTFKAVPKPVPEEKIIVGEVISMEKSDILFGEVVNDNEET